MQIGTTLTPTLSGPTRKMSFPPGTKCTYDAKEDSYHFEAPGFHSEVRRMSPLEQAGIMGAVVGVPSAVGALETSLLGMGASGLMSLVLSPTAGAVMGGAMMGMAAWKATNKNPIFTGLAAILGAGIGTVAWPLLKLPGTLAGVDGALVATTVTSVATAAWAFVQNRKLDETAKEFGAHRP